MSSSQRASLRRQAKTTSIIRPIVVSTLGGANPPSTAPARAIAEPPAPITPLPPYMQHARNRAKSPRIKQLASQLSIIKISLDPPSPPPAEEFREEEESAILSPQLLENHTAANEETGLLHPHDAYHEGDAASSMSFAHWWHHHDFPPINSANLLQVPRGEAFFPEEIPRQTSPPPRRCSYASTLSENSSVSLNTSYQNLLAPFSPLVLNITTTSSSNNSTRRSSSATRSFSESEWLDTAPNANDFPCEGSGRLTVLGRPRSVSSLSTPGCDTSVSPPTVLLSPVLSRPVRSLSSASPNSSPFLIRSTSTGGGGDGTSLLYDSEGETSAVTMRRQKIIRHNDSSPLATPPPSHSPPVWGGICARQGPYSRHSSFTSSQQTPGRHHSHIFQRTPYHSTHQHAYPAAPAPTHKHRSAVDGGGSGSLSQNDSFESTGSGSHFLSPSSNFLTTTLSGAFLQRSRSDAQEAAYAARQRLQAKHLAGEGSPLSGARSSIEKQRQLHRSYLDRVRKMHGRRASNMAPFRPISSAADNLLLNTSLDSTGAPANFSTTHQSSNLMRLWRLCPLGHSDPQLYTQSIHHHSPSPHRLPHADGVSPTLLGGKGPDRTPRRSFLSTSPLTTKLKRESLLTASPLDTRRSSGSGGSSGRLGEPTMGLGNSASPSSSLGGGATGDPHSYHRHHRPSRCSPFTYQHLQHHQQHTSPTSGQHRPSTQLHHPHPPRLRMRSFAGPSSSIGESSSLAIRPTGALRHPAQAAVALRHHYHGGGGMRAGSSLAAPLSYLENRRWSLASLPSSSGYGTPGSNTGSAFSSQYSSQEHLAEALGDLRMGGGGPGGQRFDSNDSYSQLPMGDVEATFSGGTAGSGMLSSSGCFRPRSRSLNSPIGVGLTGGAEAGSGMLGAGGGSGAGGYVLAPSIYKERFPKAKIQMENRLQQFIVTNAPLSGFTTSMALNLATGGASSSSTPPPMSQRARPISIHDRATSPSPMAGVAQHSPPQHHLLAMGPPSPRAGSPLPPRPVSPLVTESATAVGNELVRSSSTSHYQYQAPSLAGSNVNLAVLAPSSPRASFSHYIVSASQQQESGDSPTLPPPIDPYLLRLLSDGATRFLHHQICEIAADCLSRSRDDTLTCSYFCDMSIHLDETLAEAEVKTSGGESCKFLARLVKQLLMIVARTARLLECLEFDPDEFYQLLEEAEGAVRTHLGAGRARVPDLPQYIIAKLGLNKELLGVDQGEEDEAAHEDDEHLGEGGGRSDASHLPHNYTHGELNAPREEDFQTIRLISNGAYGAVYLVRHRRTRQRFALKMMKKQTLLLRNQVEQVYAERDILTFTDNPFVVSFYGSFETKQHLCMLMEYVEGGDCASLLKSAGTLPIELTRLYIAETLLAIEYLHSCGIVHRDLKGDNLLITAMGHIKLTDFGLSKIGLMNRTTMVSEGFQQQLDETHQFNDNQLCGTPEYIAPEVILRQGYGKPVDWWALGIILYEFLVGIVPFLGGTPEELFTNIINEEVEYPSDDEALDADAESLIRLLLEKNPVDRLGTVGGAAQVAAHPFFTTLDFDTLLRQKAEFVPLLENDEDTSYFDSRVDRYNHDAMDSPDEEAPAMPMFWSFSTASPRHSIVGGQLDLPPGGLAALESLHAASLAARNSGDEAGEEEASGPPPLSLRSRASQQGLISPLAPSQMLRKFSAAVSEDSGSGQGTPSTGGSGAHHFPFYSQSPRKPSHSRLSHGHDSQDSQPEVSPAAARTLPPSSGSVSGRSPERTTARTSTVERGRLLSDSSGLAGARPPLSQQMKHPQQLQLQEPQEPIPSAVILRRRFSAARHANHSTSSSGTTTTTGGGGVLNTTTTCSSTDSSMDLAYGPGIPPRTHSHTQQPLPRFAISPCEQLFKPAVPCQQQGLLAGEQLSPVDESAASGTRAPTDKRPSAVGQQLIAPTAGNSATSGEPPSGPPMRSTRSASCRSDALLRVVIPGGSSGSGSVGQGSSPGSTASASPQQQQAQQSGGGSSYYLSYTGGGGSAAASLLSTATGPGQLSPSRHSISSASSFDSSTTKESPNLFPTPLSSSSTQRQSSSTSPLPPIGPSAPSSLLPPPSNIASLAGSGGGAKPPSPTSKPIVIKKGPQGYGFTIRSVRVYLSEVSEYYTIEHLVAAVKEASPAYGAGLRANDLITHVHTKPVHNMTHPQLMHRLLSCGNELTLHVVPMSNTSIKEGEARKTVGKLLRKKPRRPTAAQKKGPRKASALLRRLSGKRAVLEVLPGASSQKQMFMPRSVSSQDGALYPNQQPAVVAAATMGLAVATKSNFLTAEPQPVVQPGQQPSLQPRQAVASPMAQEVEGTLPPAANVHHRKRLSIPSSAASAISSPSAAAALSSGGGRQKPSCTVSPSVPKGPSSRKLSASAGQPAASMPVSPLARLPAVSAATSAPREKPGESISHIRAEEKTAGTAKEEIVTSPANSRLQLPNPNMQQSRNAPELTAGRRLSPSRLMQRLLKAANRDQGATPPNAGQQQQADQQQQGSMR